MLWCVNAPKIEAAHAGSAAATGSSRACMLCGADAFDVLCVAGDRLGLVPDRFEVRRCRECGLAATWPDASEVELARFYPDEYWGESSEPRHEWIVRTQREKTSVLATHRPEGGRILDVGCGAGFFLRALDAESWDRFGVEISARSASVAERHLGEGRVFAGRLVDAAFDAASFDVVTFWASLEHVTDPAINLALARKILQTNGLLVVQVPNIASVQAVRFKGDWFALDLPRHRHHFSPDTLERFVRRAGFEPVALLRRSETHDPHALKQSLKTQLVHKRAVFGRARYYLAAPFVKLVDRLTGGATLTLVARPV